MELSCKLGFVLVASVIVDYTAEDIDKRESEIESR